MSFVACSSAPATTTTDICSLEKHEVDNIFQVRINDEPINQNYYTYEEAQEITKLLAKKNKCRSR